MQLCKLPSPLSAQRLQRPAPAQASRSVLVQAASVDQQETRKESSSSSAPSSSTTTVNGKEIYIGFPKGDYAPRTGRKGRVITDDPSRYPAKENMGLFYGATGGWAGGEAALVKLKESIKNEVASDPRVQEAAKNDEPVVISKQGVPIYVGFGKDELEKRKSGAKGRVIIDSAERYPAKENIGFLSGATGGFAGGERGLRQFVETGEVGIRKPGEPGGQPMSPLGIAFLMLLAGTGGAALLTQLSAGEGIPIPPPETLQSLTKFDAFTVNVLTGAAALGLVVGGIFATKAATQAVRASVENAGKEVVNTGTKVAVYALFFGAVFLAARAVLEV